MSNGFLYILQSDRNHRYYIGSTNDVVRRLAEHNRGKVASTRLTKPWKVVYFKSFETLTAARQAEFALKKLKSRKVIDQMISQESRPG